MRMVAEPPLPCDDGETIMFNELKTVQSEIGKLSRTSSERHDRRRRRAARHARERYWN
jgi:hypothetical protein